MRVAQSMLNKGKNEEAEKALDLSLQYFPTSKIFPDKYMLSYVDLYYAAKATEKANNMALQLANIFSQDLNFYLSLEPKYSSQYEEEMSENAYLLQRLSQVASQNGQDSTAKVIEAMINLKLSQ